MSFDQAPILTREVDDDSRRCLPRIPDFDLLRMIGRGSYGDVWLARSLTGAFRAVKIIWRDRFDDPEPFEREFRGLKEFSAISLSHPGQLALLHVGRADAQGFFYYVMELADDAGGATRFDPATYVPLTLQELKTRRGRLSTRESLSIGISMARSLDGLHAGGLLHRDIKPSNIILVNGSARLADIGLVASRYHASTFVGTEGFVPPEGPGTPAADVYALGKVLYELTVGLPGEDFPKLPSAPLPVADRSLFARFNAIILKACSPDPKNRHTDGSALLAELLALQDATSSRQSRANEPRKLRLPLFVFLVGLAVLIGGALALSRFGPVSPARPADAPDLSTKPPAIAVLPFANLSDDKANEFFADGMTEELLNLLSRNGSLKVSARASAFYFKGRNESTHEIAKKLGVCYIVEGSVRRMGSRVRITAYLTRMSDGVSLWSDTYDRGLDDIFAIQDEITGIILERLLAVVDSQGVASARPGATPLPLARNQNFESYRLTIEGRYQLNKHTGEALARAEELFTQATQISPESATAWAGLADALGWLYSLGHRPYAESVPKAIAAARKSVQLDPRSGASRAILAGVLMESLDWQGAKRELATALSLEPRNASVLQVASWINLNYGNFTESIHYARQSVELDPFSFSSYLNIGMAQIALRRSSEAEATGRRLMDLDAKGMFGPFITWTALFQQGRFAEVLAMAEATPDPCYAAFIKIYTFLAQGKNDEATALFEAQDNTTLFDRAEFHAFSGDRDTAFALLRQALADRDRSLLMVKHLPFLEPLRGDPRWPEFMRDMGLPATPPR